MAERPALRDVGWWRPRGGPAPAPALASFIYYRVVRKETVGMDTNGGRYGGGELSKRTPSTAVVMIINEQGGEGVLMKNY